MSDEICETCRFGWFFDDGTDSGICRLNPPIPDGKGQSHFPLVYRMDWCGKYETT